MIYRAMLRLHMPGQCNENISKVNLKQISKLFDLETIEVS